MADREWVRYKRAMTQAAIVTGASSGIGLSVARALVEAGMKVALVARTASKLDELTGELGRERAAAFPLDVGDFETVAALPARVAERFGSLDVVVNNAGINHRGPVFRRTWRELADIIDVNLVAPIVLTRAAIEVMRPGGSIVNVASLAGMVPVPDEAAYCASKAGLRAFARAVGEELRARDIHVGNVCPGPVDTGFFGADLDHVPDLVFSQPMSSAEQVASAVLECIRTRSAEIAIPSLSGKLATLGYVFPAFARKLRPVLEKRGAANKRAYAAKKAR
jgi:short-subunit dehydrogenase